MSAFELYINVSPGGVGLLAQADEPVIDHDSCDGYDEQQEQNSDRGVPQDVVLEVQSIPIWVNVLRASKE